MRQHRNSMPCLVAWHRIFFCLFLGGLAVGREASPQHSKKQRILSFVLRGPKVWGVYDSLYESTTLSESLLEIKREVGSLSKFVF